MKRAISFFMAGVPLIAWSAANAQTVANVPVPPTAPTSLPPTVAASLTPRPVTNLREKPLRRAPVMAVGAQEKPQSAASAYLPAGQPTPPPLTRSGYQLFGTVRVREEDWNWFPTPKANGAYTFLGGYARVGVSRSTSNDDFVAEFAAPFLAGLPTHAIASAPQGALGFGASYYGANHNQVADFFLKNGYFRFKHAGNPANSVRIGRFEYSDGVETDSADPSLNWVKQNRIGQRLIGPFGYSDIGRSFDGVQLTNNTRLRNITLAYMMPTRGVYDLDGWDTLTDNRLYYAAATYPQPGPHAAGEGRLFVLYYEDARNGDVKTDNRPLTGPAGTPMRTGDRSAIRYTTFGGNYTRVEPVGDGKIDGMFWGAGQAGSWGQLQQGAIAFAAEMGYQPHLPRLNPWLRVGYNYFSGDGNSADGVHGTFIAPAPTPRVYARTPFFTDANLKDLFAQLILRPTPRLSVRTDVHGLRLADSHDLWYGGGGAYDLSNFGYTGRPSNGHSNLGTLYDTSIDYQALRSLTLSLYFGYCAGGDVVKSIYTSGDLTFGYFEATFHF